MQNPMFTKIGTHGRQGDPQISEQEVILHICTHTHTHKWNSVI